MKRITKAEQFPGMKYTQVSVRVWVDWLDIVRKAAKKAGISVPQYVRSRLLPMACDELGIDEPEFPPLDKGGAPTAQSYAARKFGMPVKDWRNMALDKIAEQTIKTFESGAPPSAVVKPHRRVR